MKDSFRLCNKNFEVLDSCWSEEQTLEEVSNSSADHENAGPLHLVTSSSLESYDLDIAFSKSLMNQQYFRTNILISVHQQEELKQGLFMDQLFIQYETIFL